MLYFSVCEISYLYFSACGISCYIFSACGISRNIFSRVEFCVTFFRVWNFVLYFCAFGTRFGILCYIFVCVEFCVIFSACVTHSGILCYIFPRVEFCVIFFRMRNPLWNFMLNILTLLFFNFLFHACLKLSLIYSKL